MLDLTGRAGALAGKLLAGLGADVVLVEPPAGSGLRAMRPFWQDLPGAERSLFFWFYAAGKRGVVAAYRGVHVFPDSNAHGLGEQPQPLYTVRFEARELWGEAAEPNQRVHIDLWESYLQRA